MKELLDGASSQPISCASIRRLSQPRLRMIAFYKLRPPAVIAKMPTACKTR